MLRCHHGTAVAADLVVPSGHLNIYALKKPQEFFDKLGGEELFGRTSSNGPNTTVLHEERS
jgi:hypothetical protein